MSTIKPEQLDKLPQWAQDHIWYLERRHLEDREFIRRACEGDPDSNVRVHDYVHPDRMLPENSLVDFYTGEKRTDRYADVISVHHAGDARDEVEITAYAARRKRLAVTPSNGNVIRVKLVNW